MTRRLLSVAAVALALAAPAAAGERNPTLPELEREVMCPTCNSLLELSQSPISERMRVFIRHRISAGDTKSEIKQKLVAEFGEAVLAAPARSGLDLLAWLLPLAGLLVAGAFLSFAVWRWSHAPEPAPADERPPPNGPVRLDPGLERRLERELARFDT
jgi:cytochrome c-type biogenesis protein CcmH